jgi:hypothetical protein
LSKGKNKNKNAPAVELQLQFQKKKEKTLEKYRFSHFFDAKTHRKIDFTMKNNRKSIPKRRN